MDVALSYATPSDVETGGGRARVRLSGARERGAASFRGVVKEPLVLREALLALHEVVISDLRWRPKESRAEFERWLEGWLDRHAASERKRLDAERRRALEWRWSEQAAPWAILDPVVSVHPDQVVFEAFSRDGSTYGRVGLDRDALAATGEVILGTTNVDFGSALYEAVRRLRSIFPTELAVGRDHLEVQTGAAPAHREKKVDLPVGWIRGFVQLSAAGLVPALAVELLPVHVHDICRHLRLHRAKVSPRALRWELEPGQPAVAVMEPWEDRLVLHGSTHDATERRVVRTWGRNRLRLVERTIPIAKRFTVHLLGRGLPYFVTARGPGVDVTLGLSGWTKANWTTTARLDALIARRRGKGADSPRPLLWLEQHHKGTPREIADATGATLPDVHASLVAAAGRGLVVYDLLHGVYRHRPLFAGPLPPEATLGDDPEQASARALVGRGAAVVTATRREVDGTTRVDGRVVEDPAHTWEPWVTVSDEGTISGAGCGCFFAKQHGLKQGPCAHVQALLLVQDED